MNDPYQSVRNKINLPKTHNIKKDISTLHQNVELFHPLSKQNEADLNELSEPLLIKTNELVNELNESFYIYENP